MEEYLKFIIERFDHYYDSTNNKGQFYLGLNTFLIGGTIGALLYANEKGVLNVLLCCLLSVSLGCIFLSILFTLSALQPFTRSGHSRNYQSLLFFGSITELTDCKIFRTKMNKQSTQERLEDLQNQCYTLAQGLTSKFRKLKNAGRLIWLTFLILIPSAYILFITLRIN